MSVRRGRGLLFFFAAGLAGLFLLRGLELPATLAPWRPRESRRAAQPLYAAPGTELTLTRLVAREGGRKAWEFKAGRINRTIDGLVLTAVDISDGIVYDDEEKISYTFSAGELRYEVLTRRLSIKGGLTGRLAGGDALFQAGEAVADLKRKTMEIPVPVKVESEEVTLSADRLSADLEAEEVVLKGNAVVTWSGGTIKADEVTYSVKDGSFTVSGGPGEGVELIL